MTLASNQGTPMKSLYVLSAFAALATATGASAATITIDQGSPYQTAYDYGSMGAGRGVSFLATQNFSITSMGVDLGILATNSTNYVYQIFSSTNGHNVGSLLASTTFQLNAGSGYQDKALSFAFNAGSYYVVNFARADGASFGSNLGTHYAYEGAASLISYGPLTVVEGFEGTPINNSNPLMIYTRLTTVDATAAVPEPATWAMMIGGFGLVGASMRYRRRKVAVSFA